ncbi:SHOCT domain-containing protein [Lactobacillus helveticus]|uniref:Bacteriophage-like protein n=1 Tax=Lactobacillus helveticus CIRM-BIA 953 TaxID=1226335 RepID=U4QM37_LACHE|nr:SHOCT domain-containing protein [Lactobacillus helveticus]CDI42789.1 Bacteriophage-like protein [Lactobacillus helveticus CIRM-BIA 953]
MGLFDLFSKKQKNANQSFLAEQRGQQAIVKINKLALPERLKKQLIDAGVFDIWFNDEDLAPLIAAVKDEEIIQYAAIGINEHSENVMLVCSNCNLIILKKKHSDEQVEVIDLKQVKSVILKNQLMYGELSLIVGNQSLDINSINKVPAEILADNIKKWSKIAQGEDDDFDQQLEQVKKLKELLDQGILTEEEFQAKKKQILKI